jgi:hypothetical protein
MDKMLLGLSLLCAPALAQAKGPTRDQVEIAQQARKEPKVKAAKLKGVSGRNTHLVMRTPVRGRFAIDAFHPNRSQRGSLAPTLYTISGGFVVESMVNGEVGGPELKNVTVNQKAIQPKTMPK